VFVVVWCLFVALPVCVFFFFFFFCGKGYVVTKTRISQCRQSLHVLVHNSVHCCLSSCASRIRASLEVFRLTIINRHEIISTHSACCCRAKEVVVHQGIPSLPVAVCRLEPRLPKVTGISAAQRAVPISIRWSV